MQETAQNAFGFAHLWSAGDFVSHTVAYALAAMSIASWYLILAKGWDWYRARRAARAACRRRRFGRGAVIAAPLVAGGEGGARHAVYAPSFCAPAKSGCHWLRPL